LDEGIAISDYENYRERLRQRLAGARAISGRKPCGRRGSKVVFSSPSKP
jgi:hypothetical protein